MRRFRRSLTTLGFATFLWTSAFAETYNTTGFPPAHDLFPSLLADPTEPRFVFEYGAPVSQSAIARVNLGDYLGLYRWTLANGQVAIQSNVGGSVNTRFDGTAEHSLQVIDYYGNVPIDIAWGPWAARMMFYHDSSHLGDDYLRKNNIQGEDNSWEALRGIMSVHPWQAWRFYAGYQHAVHTKPAWRGRDALQGGMEIYFNNSEHVHWHPYLATDLQSWARSAWNPTFTAEIGIKTGAQYSRGRGISYFVHFSDGPRFEGQFYNQKETLWTIGLKFQMSQAPDLPPTETRALPSPKHHTPW